MSQLLWSAPYFPVADVERSATHYERVLGFRLPIMLRLADRPEDISPNEKEFAVRDHDGYVLGFGEPRGGPDHHEPAPAP
ncbi:MAG TPA: hypothetical protein VEQ84_16500 [Vicinamibacteria bacterium]|nr:hypothetical protein [Vicinamibacteria bacterium]